MKITLITVCYNSASVIRTALESVSAQKGADVEYLVIDGGSSDGTVDILKDFEIRVAKERPDGKFAFRWISERDKGMYDAMNKGIRMSTGDVIGLLNADDVLAEDDVLARVAAAFEGDRTLDGTYGDIRFVKDAGESSESVASVRERKTIRYCSGRWFRPWQFRFGVQTAHPSTFFTRACFDRWGEYSLDYGMFGDFELLCRFIWKNRAVMRYVPLCTTVMRAGGASTNGWRTTVKINKTDLRALKANGCHSCLPLLYLRYLLKIWGYVFKG